MTTIDLLMFGDEIWVLRDVMPPNRIAATIRFLGHKSRIME